MSPRKLPEFLSPEGIEALLAAAPHGQARLLMLMQWRAGLRISEALALRPADIDYDDGVIKVRQGKGKRDRIVPLHAELANALRLQAAGRRAAQTRPIITAHRATAWKWVQEAYRRAQDAGTLAPGLRIGTHTLRHSFARHLLAHGVGIHECSAWLGHAHISTTMIYLAIIPDARGRMAAIP